MTLDEAIKICEEDAEKIGGNPQSDRHAERCRQFAEWLTELKELREQIQKAKSMILDYSYTVEVMCNRIKNTMGCENCTYCNAETYDCEVRAYITKTRAFVKGNEALALIGEDGGNNA